MVARIKAGKGISGIVNYNEYKVSKGVAKLLFASNYPTDAERLTYNQKLKRLENLAATNKSVHTNAVHISLNFDVKEHLEEEKLIQIAAHYMEKTGFGDQPFLVYKHWDAAHPHIHIVTTNVADGGKRIDMHNIGRTKSEDARKEIEQLFGLVVAESKKRKAEDLARKVDLERALYGKSETKNAISNIVREVYSSYKYASLAEYNAILGIYGVMADRGEEGSKMYERRGLVYSLLDEKGGRVGVPIKASAIYDQPTIKNLEARFEKNKEDRAAKQDRARASIEKVFNSFTQVSRGDFVKAMEKERIHVIFRQNQDGFVYGVTFVDHITRCVFNGSELGKQFSAGSLQKRFSEDSLSMEDAQKYSTALSSIVSSLKKENPAYYFESTLLRELSRIDLFTPLRSLFPQEEEKTLRLAIRNYSDYKATKIPEVESRERDLFKYQTSAYIRFINESPVATLKDKLLFLYSNDIAIQEDRGGVVISSTKGEHISYRLEHTSAAQLLRTSELLLNVTISPDEKIPFSRLEKKLFQNYGSLQTSPIHFEKHSITNVSLPKLRRFFSPENFSHLEHQLNGNYLSEIRSRINFSKGIETVINDLALRGVLIYPVRAGGTICGYKMGYYRTAKENFVDAPGELSGYLIKNGFTEKTASHINSCIVQSGGGKDYSLRYDIMVRMRQSLDQGAYRQLPKALDLIKNLNEPLHDQLKFQIKSIENNPNFMGEGSERQKNIDRLSTRLLLHTLMGYPGPDLKPVENSITADPASRRGEHQNYSLHQGSTLLGGLLQCLESPENEPSDQMPVYLYKPKKKRKRRKFTL